MKIKKLTYNFHIDFINVLYFYLEIRLKIMNNFYFVIHFINISNEPINREMN